VIEIPWADAAFEAVARVVAERTGLVFPDARRDSVEQGVREAAVRAGVADLRAYAELLARDGTLLDALVTELTVGETYFFREPQHFAFVRERLLPDVLRQRGPGHVVRAWSAACSTGEEAYSLSILFDEAGIAERPTILATDISRRSLRTARLATYREWSLRGVPAKTVERYFRYEPGPAGVPNAGCYDFEPRLRLPVTFDYLNLALDAYPSLETGTWGMDLIFCRNVLIYLDRHTIARVADGLRRSLAPDGWLVTASSDPPLSDYTDLTPTATPWGVFYRHKASSTTTATTVAIPAVERSAPARVAPPADPVDDLAPDAAASARAVRALANLEVAEAERACQTALERHPLSVELHYLHAVLLVALGRLEDAIRSAQWTLYLDRTCVVAYLILGGLLRRTGDRAAARRAYRNAHNLLVALPPDAAVPLAEGECAGRLAEVAAIEVELLGDRRAPVQP
jgi:chemotaxis protein methyltransferase CheR